MGSAVIEKSYSVNTSIKECFNLVQKALQELGLKKLRIEKEVSPRYLLIEYKFSLLEKAQVQFTFKDKADSSEILLKWRYPFSTEKEMLALTKDNGLISVAQIQGEERRKSVERLIEEFKCRIGAVEILPNAERKVNEKEIIREKEVIVKIRCPYCRKLYDETLNVCPHCGGNR